MIEAKKNLSKRSTTPVKIKKNPKKNEDVNKRNIPKEKRMVVEKSTRKKKSSPKRSWFLL